MKKQILTSLIILGLNVSFAQLTVLENGNVGIGNSNPVSLFTIGGNYNSLFTASIEGQYIGLEVTTKYPIPYEAGYWGMAIEGTRKISASSYSRRGDIGIVGGVRSNTPLTTGRAIGVLGVAQNATSRYNYGVIGAITGNNHGTGILGQADGEYLGQPISGIYAGYFIGNVRVTGSITASVVSESDLRFKQNIVTLGSAEEPQTQNMTKNSQEKNTLSNILELNPVQYNYKQVYFEPEEATGDTLTAPVGYFDEKAPMFQRKHYGLIAQELQELYPELVYEDNNGYLSVDYIGLIPLMIQSIKDLNSKIETMESAGSALTKNARAAGASVNETVLSETSAVLYQNTPNPFTQSTSIKYFLPETVTTAALCIYDMQGKQLKQITLTGRGEGAELISASQFSPGMYLYALIADGREVDVKRMILTE